VTTAGLLALFAWSLLVVMARFFGHGCALLTGIDSLFAGRLQW